MFFAVANYRCGSSNAADTMLYFSWLWSFFPFTLSSLTLPSLVDNHVLLTKTLYRKFEFGMTLELHKDGKAFTKRGKKNTSYSPISS